MLFLRICFDKPGAGALRDDLRKTHREYVGSHVQGRGGVQVVQGGPMCADDDLQTNIGSFLVVEAPSLTHVQSFHDNDPFTQAGLFQRSEVIRWDRHIGNPGQTNYNP